MHGYNGLHFRPRARQFDHVEATKAKPDGSAPADIADGTPVGFSGQGIERGCDATAHTGRVGQEWTQEFAGVFRSYGAIAFPEHVSHEDRVPFCGQVLTSID